ncbi:trafficking protein particle complex subunit 10 [Amylostereum chailletii]|nr:trafficking protein particle complex subunit 10 [Amylostereum chailletii]
MSLQHVVVTYAAPQSFLSSDQWKQIRDALKAQLPFRSIHWKPPSLTSVRTIQELDVLLAPFESARDEHTSQIPSSLLDKPLLNIYVVTCEDNDTYKGSVRKQIKDWHALVSQRKNQEWLILHVVRADTRNAAAGFFQRGSMLDKIKADFNADRRERCVQLAWPMGQNNPAVWAELLSKIKDGILSAFDASISQREVEVKRSEEQRLMPGWNFCTFFVLKESLATSYEGMNLLEDALRQYDELEISFHHVLREKNLSWFGTLIVASPKDDSSPLLSVTRKPYRDLILANTVSVFDLEIYVLARQCALLARIGKVAEVCRKTHRFLVTFGRQLWDAANILPPYFIESWVYSSALSVVEQADAWANDLTLGDVSLNTFNTSKAELLELARSQLDVLGVSAGHLPSRPPFTTIISPLRPSVVHDKRASRVISQPQLVVCLGSDEAFYELYTELTTRAIDIYAKAGRRKSAVKLHGSLAALDIHRGRLATAFQTYSSLPAHYGPHDWISLESYMLSQAIDTHSRIGGTKDKQWLILALSFLKTHIDGTGRDLVMAEDDRSAYVHNIVDSLKTAAEELDSDFTHSEHSALSFRIPNSNARPAEDEDGCYLDVLVHNHLPCELPVTKMLVTLAGQEEETLEFTADVSSLAPGEHTLSLFCPTSSWGTFIHVRTEVWISHLHLRWSNQLSTKSKSRLKKSTPGLVRLVRDVQALDVRVRRPRKLVLGAPPHVLLTISSGRNHVAKVTMNISTPDAVEFRCQDAILEENGTYSSATLEAEDGCVYLINVPEDTALSVLVPHTDATKFHAIQIHIAVSYNTHKHPSIFRSMSLTSRLPTSLPVAVNVQDFFRGKSLFTRFTISTTTYQHIRLSSAHLEIPSNEDGGVTLKRTEPLERNILTITPARPANILFLLEADRGKAQDSLHLCIKYRMLRDEVEALVDQAIHQVLSESPVTVSSHRSRLAAHIVQVLESDPAWVQPYSVTGELLVPKIETEGEVGELLARVISLLKSSRPADVSGGTWREITIPVDIPLMTILAAARLTILPTPFPTSAPSSRERLPLYAGQPVSANLTIQTSLHWGSGDRSRKSYRLRFDVEELIRDWLVSGRKRGDFEVKDGETYSVPITLIALHHGELPLPKVIVTPLPMAGEMTMGSLSIPACETYQVHGAEKVLVLPRGGRTTFVVSMGEGVS